MNTLNDIWNNILGNVYFRFLLILSMTLVIAFISKLILKRILKPLARRTKTRIDDLIIKSLSSVIFYMIIALGLKVGLQQVELEAATLNSLVDTVLVVIISILIIKVINNFTKHWKVEWAAKTESTADDRLIPLVEKIMEAVVIILAAIFIFDAWNVNISPLLGAAGVAGIAVSFAVKDSLTNILGGIQLVMDKTFKVGDKVALESGELGIILDIGLRSTKLKTYDNEVIYIPNGTLANTKIKNFTVPDLTIRVNVEFGVVYGSDPEKVRQVVLEAVKKTENVMAEPEPVVQFLKMSDFSLDFVARAWVKEYTLAYDMKVTLTDAIYNALNKAGIGIPFPTRTVYTKTLD